MSNVEFRASFGSATVEDNANIVKVEGYAAVFGETTDVAGVFRERIARGAFANAVKNDDVRFLINHAGLPLARTKSGTLVLQEDAKGLLMRATLDANDPEVRSIVPKMRRGDLDGMSFAFQVIDESWTVDNGVSVRTINEVRLRDVAVVTYAQYQEPSISLRQKADICTKQEHFSATTALKMRMKLALAGAK